MKLTAVRYLGVLSLVFLVSACATTPAPVQSAASYFEEGDQAFASRDYEEAIAKFKKVRESYSSPELTTRADLKIADAHFENGAYIEAAAAYEDFRKLHPTNEKAGYALYRQGLSHYHQVAGIDTDQTPVKNAVLTLQGFLDLYPDSPYAPEVREKLADCRAKQLAYENYVGNFYLRTGKYQAAIKRLSEALERFPGGRLDETLFHLAKAYVKSGEMEKGKEVLKRLAKEYPESGYNAEAADL